jgi:serine/threonine-protein kinase RsbW
VEQASITGEAVRLSVPAALEYVRIVRLTASGVASRLGFDVDELENLRVAVDELASLVLEVADGGNLDVDFIVRGEQLVIEGRVPAALGSSVQAPTLTAQILKAVIDEYQLRVDDGVARFHCVRRLPSA